MSATSSTDDVGSALGIFDILRGYSSTLEVQLMIDKSLCAFETRKLPSLLDLYMRDVPEGACVRNGLGGGTQEVTICHAEGDVMRSEPLTTMADHLPVPIDERVNADRRTPFVSSPEWLETLVQAHVEAAIAKKLEERVSLEVERQLRLIHKDGIRATVGVTSPRPPLPPVPAAAPSMPTTSLHNTLHETSITDTEGALSTSPAAVSVSEGSAPAEVPNDSGRRQREKILSAIHDVEHQVNTLQRQVNEIAHQYRTAQQRLVTLCYSLQPQGDVCPGYEPMVSTESTEEKSQVPADRDGSSPDRFFFASVRRALDAQKSDDVRQLIHCALLPLVQASIASLLPRNRGDCETPVTGTLVSPSNAHVPPTGRSALLTPTSSHISPPRDTNGFCRDALADTRITHVDAINERFNDAISGVSSGLQLGYMNHPSPVRLERTELSPGSHESVASLRCSASHGNAYRMMPQECVARVGVGTPERYPSAGGSLSNTIPCATPLSKALSLSGRSLLSHSPSRTPIHRAASPIGGFAWQYADSEATGGSTPQRRPHRQHHIPSPSPDTLPRLLPSSESWGSSHHANIVLGISTVDVEPGILPGSLKLWGGVRVVSLVPGQLAERSGICVDDVIVSVFDGRVVQCSEELAEALREARYVDVVRMLVYRHTSRASVAISLSLESSGAH